MNRPQWVINEWDQRAPHFLQACTVHQGKNSRGTALRSQRKHRSVPGKGLICEIPVLTAAVPGGYKSAYAKRDVRLRQASTRKSHTSCRGWLPGRQSTVF